MATNQIYTMDDLFDARYASQGLSQLGLEAVLNSLVAYGNFLVEDAAEQLRVFCGQTENAREVWGGVAKLSFQEVDEFGKGETQKDIKDQELHYPLRKISAAHGMSNEFFKRADGREIAKLMLEMDNGFNQRIRDEIKTTIFKNTSTQWKSNIYPRDGLLQKIQPFLNADSATIPDAPNGTTFTASSHNHYAGTTGSSLTFGDIDLLLSNVREHFADSVNVRLFVDSTMPATLSALSGTKFVYNQFVNVVDQTAGKIGATVNLGGGNRANTFIGVWDGSEVWTRSWVPANYIVAMADNPLSPAILRRVDPLFQGMQSDGIVTDGRLTVQEFYAYMGFGVYNRAAGAVLQTNAQSYSIPSGLLR